MEENDLERELSNLGNEFQKETLSISLIPSTLRILKGRAIPSWRMSLRAIAKQSDKVIARHGVPWQSFLVALSLLVLFTLIRLFSFSTEPLLNITKMVFLVFSLITGTLFIFKPEKMIKADKKVIGRLSFRGAIATPLQETILFRLQGLYFILIAFLVCKL